MSTMGPAQSVQAVSGSAPAENKKEEKKEELKEVEADVDMGGLFGEEYWVNIDSFS